MVRVERGIPAPAIRESPRFDAAERWLAHSTMLPGAGRTRRSDTEPPTTFDAAAADPDEQRLYLAAASYLAAW
jgi:hypothetical protein